MHRFLRPDVVILGLSFIAQLARDIILIALLGLGGALDVIKASTAILIYLFTTFAAVAANQFFGEAQKNHDSIRIGDFLAVYSIFALIAQFVLFEYVVAPGFAPEKMAEAKSYALIALGCSLVIAPYTLSRFLNIRQGKLSLVAAQQLVTAVSYILIFLALSQFIDSTAAGVIALCIGITGYVAFSIASSGVPWKQLDWTLTGAGLALWVSLFSSHALQASSRFIDRAFASHIGDGYFALIDLVYVCLAGASVIPFTVFNIYIAPILGGRPDYVRWGRQALIVIGILGLITVIIAAAVKAELPAYQIGAVRISIVEIILALVSIGGFLPNAIAFNAFLVLGQGRPAFIIVAVRTLAKVAFLLAVPKIDLFIVLVSMVFVEALASFAFAWLAVPPPSGSGGSPTTDRAAIPSPAS